MTPLRIVIVLSLAMLVNVALVSAFLVASVLIAAATAVGLREMGAPLLSQASGAVCVIALLIDFLFSGLRSLGGHE